MVISHASTQKAWHQVRFWFFVQHNMAIGLWTKPGATARDKVRHHGRYNVMVSTTDVQQLFRYCTQKTTPKHCIAFASMFCDTQNPRVAWWNNELQVNSTQQTNTKYT